LTGKVIRQGRLAGRAQGTFRLEKAFAQTGAVIEIHKALHDTHDTGDTSPSLAEQAGLNRPCFMDAGRSGAHIGKILSIQHTDRQILVTFTGEV